MAEKNLDHQEGVIIPECPAKKALFCLDIR